MKRKSLALTLALALAVSVVAPQAPIDAAPLLTLSDAQRIAVVNHPDIKSVQFDAAAADEAVKIARSAYAPQVLGTAAQAFAGPGTRIGAYNVLSDPTIIQRTSIGVGVSQYITDFGRTTALVRASDLEREAQIDRTHLTRDMVLLNVTRAYLEVLRADALLRVAEQTRSERATLLSQVQALQHAGLRSTLDVSTMARDVSEADQLVLEAHGRQIDAEATLTEAMGMTDAHAYNLEDFRRLPAMPKDADTVVQLAMRENPALASLEAHAAATEANAEAISRNTMPTVAGYGFVGASPYRANESIGSSYATAGVNLTVPIFNGGALAAEKRQAADEFHAAAENVAAERDRLARDVRIAFERTNTAHGNIAVSQQILSTARKTLELTQARYRIGLNSVVDLSEEQLLATQAEIGKTNAMYDYILQHAILDFTTGILAGAAI